MLSLEDISLFVGGRLLVKNASFNVNRGDRIGVVGRNGTGKSHLMELLAGHISPDGGVRKLQKGTTVLLVKQELPEDDKTPLDFLRDNDPDIQELEEKIEASESEEFGALYSRLAELDEERYETLAPQILRGLGLTDDELSQPMRNLSGGFRMRINLALALVRTPDILLLDEPTNHLDLESTQWLIEFLKHYPPHCAFVIVTHDIKLLTELSTSTVHLRGGVLTQFAGGYNDYRQQLAVEKIKDTQRNADLEKRIDRKTELYYRFRDLPESRAAQAVAQKRGAEKLKTQLVEIVQEQPVVQLAFSEPCELRDPIIRLNKASIAYGEKTILDHLDLSIQSGSKIGLLGRNGEGKSTLVKLLADKLKPAKGLVERCPRLNIGYFSQDLTDELDSKLTVYQQFSVKTGIKNDAEIRAALGQYGFSYEKSGVLIDDLSGGEKSLLLFALICTASPNLIILDEPTNHLDVETREELVKAIQRFKGGIILVSHDWDLHEQTMKQFWLAKGGTVQVYDKGLRHYQRELLQVINAHLQSQSTSPSKGLALPQSKVTSEADRKSTASAGKGKKAAAVVTGDKGSTADQPDRFFKRNDGEKGGAKAGAKDPRHTVNGQLVP